MVTIKDIAQRCGVSVAAVSKALHDSGEISEETKARVKEEAKLLGYAPNLYARALKTNRSYNIGILFDDATNNGFGHAFFSKVITALRNELESRNYDITFLSRKLAKKSDSYLDKVKQKRLDGIVVADVDFNDEKVQELLKCNIPSVAIDHESDEYNCVYSDNFCGMFDITKYCLDMGHRRIAFIHGQNTCITQQRISGFEAALKEYGVTLNPSYLVQGQYYNIEVCCEKFKQLFQLPIPPTCVMISDDYCMFGAQKAAAELGLSIPMHVSVVGYDDIDLSKYATPALTTVAQDAQCIGSTAAKILLKNIENEIKTVETAVIPVRSVIRDSVRKIVIK